LASSSAVIAAYWAAFASPAPRWPPPAPS